MKSDIYEDPLSPRDLRCPHHEAGEVVFRQDELLSEMPNKKAKAPEVGGLFAYNIDHADYDDECCISVTRVAPGQQPQRVIGWLA
jgi:hypothetical protein